MRFKLQLVIDGDSPEHAREVAVLDKDCQGIEQLGLTLAEAKAMLRGLQKVVVERQAAAFVGARSRCRDCGAALCAKGGHTVIFRTLLGSVPLDSPRLRQCRCGGARRGKTFSPLAELLTDTPRPSSSSWKRSGPPSSRTA